MLSAYILEEGEPVEVEVTDPRLEAFLRDPKNRIVKQTTVGDKLVSTCFLAFDHEFGQNGLPVLWETMIFPECDKCQRYTSHRAALAGHEEIVRKVKGEI